MCARAHAPVCSGPAVLMSTSLAQGTRGNVVSNNQIAREEIYMSDGTTERACLATFAELTPGDVQASSITSWMATS